MSRGEDLWPFIGDVDGLLEELELNFDEYHPLWRDDGTDWTIARYPGGDDYRYNGTVLVVNRKGLRRLFPPESRFQADIWKMARSYGCDHRWVDKDTLEFFVHPEASHRKPASLADADRLVKQLKELQLKKKQETRKGGPGIEVEEAPALGRGRGPVTQNRRRR